MTFRVEHHVYRHEDPGLAQKLDQILTQLTQQGKDIRKIMAGITDITSAQTTLHGDLVAENGLIKQLLTAFANQTLTPQQAQAIIDGMNADDADAKGNIALIQAALPVSGS